MKKTLFLVLVLTLSIAVMSAASAQKAQYVIGIAQFAEHASLDNCREGFLIGLAEQGFVQGENLTVDVQNAQADMGTANQIAQIFVGRSVDLICGIATPMAQAAFNAAEPQNIPVIYSAVSDPIAAMLAHEDGKHDKNITGTSDQLPITAQLKMIRAFMPEATKIGILYTTSETNSESTLKAYQQQAAGYGFEIVAQGISTGADIPMALDSLLPKVDCLNNMTDNTVVSYLAVVLDKANAAKKPVFGSEVEQVKLGCVASEGIDYLELGRQTGLLAARVLKGEFAGGIEFEQIKQSFLYVNENALAALGMATPEDDAQRAIKVSAQ